MSPVSPGSSHACGIGHVGTPPNGPIRPVAAIRRALVILAVAIVGVACHDDRVGSPSGDAPVPKPGYLSPIRLAPFDLPVVRVANDPGTAIVTTAGTGTWGADARHHYSKDQPWNADGTLLALQNRDGGTPSQVFLDGQTYEPTRLACPNYPLYEDRWHPSRAHATERVNVRDQELMWFDVVRCVKTRSWTLPFAVRGIGPSEGNLSFDGRWVALTDGTRMVVVDMEGNVIGPARDLGDCGLASCEVDWVSVAPSGRYVVVTYQGAYVRVYDVAPATLELTPRELPAGALRCTGTGEQGYLYDLGHADLTQNPFDGGEDVLVGQEHCGYRGEVVGGQRLGGVVMVRLRDGAVTGLTDPTNEAYPQHISTRNTARLGWAYVGYYPASGARFDDEIVAVKLDGSGTVERWAHKHSAFAGCYRCEPHAVPSPDGRRVLWASNWVLGGDGTPTVIQAYIVDRGSP